jgi:hypothetical protein
VGLHASGKIDLQSEEILGEHVLVRYVDYREEHNNSYKVNIAVSSYVTAHARLKLLGAMEQCGDRLIGNDTDS